MGYLMYRYQCDDGSFIWGRFVEQDVFLIYLVCKVHKLLPPLDLFLFLSSLEINQIGECMFLKELHLRNRAFLVTNKLWWYVIQRFCPKRYSLPTFKFHFFLQVCSSQTIILYNEWHCIHELVYSTAGASLTLRNNTWLHFTLCQISVTHVYYMWSKEKFRRNDKHLVHLGHRPWNPMAEISVAIVAYEYSFKFCHSLWPTSSPTYPMIDAM